MTKNRFTFILALLVAPCVTAGLRAQSTTGSDAVLGVFQNSEGDRKIQIYKHNNQYFGKLVALTNTRGRANVGMVVLKNFTHTNGKWEGKIYVPARDQDFAATLTLPDTKTLVISVKSGPMSQSKNWTRLQP